MIWCLIANNRPIGKNKELVFIVVSYTIDVLDERVVDRWVVTSVVMTVD